MLFKLQLNNINIMNSCIVLHKDKIKDLDFKQIVIQYFKIELH